MSHHSSFTQLTHFVQQAADGSELALTTSIFEIEHNAPHVRPYILRVETKLGAHLQHSRVFGQHIPIHPPQTLFSGVINDAPHQQPTKPVTP